MSEKVSPPRGKRTAEHQINKDEDPEGDGGEDVGAGTFQKASVEVLKGRRWARLTLGLSVLLLCPAKSLPLLYYLFVCSSGDAARLCFFVFSVSLQVERWCFELSSLPKLQLLFEAQSLEPTPTSTTRTLVQIHILCSTPTGVWYAQLFQRHYGRMIASIEPLAVFCLVWCCDDNIARSLDTSPRASSSGINDGHNRQYSSTYE